LYFNALNLTNQTLCRFFECNFI